MTRLTPNPGFKVKVLFRSVLQEWSILDVILDSNKKPWANY